MVDLSKEMLEALLGGKTGRLLVTALLLFADLSLGTLAKAASKLARVHLSCRRDDENGGRGIRKVCSYGKTAYLYG